MWIHHARSDEHPGGVCPGDTEACSLRPGHLIETAENAAFNEDGSLINDDINGRVKVLASSIVENTIKLRR